MNTTIQTDLLLTASDVETQPTFATDKAMARHDGSAILSATEIDLESCPTVREINRSMQSRHGRRFAYLIRRDLKDFEPLIGLIANNYVLCINHEFEDNPFSSNPSRWSSFTFKTKKTNDLMDNQPLISIGSPLEVNIRTNSITHFFHDATKHGALGILVVGECEIYLIRYAYSRSTHANFTKTITDSKTYDPFHEHSLIELEEANRMLPDNRFQQSVSPVLHFFWNEINDKEVWPGDLFLWNDMA